MTNALPSASCRKGCKPITASEEAHCIKCHDSFYTVESFDDHRRDESVAEHLPNECWEPADLGMIQEKGMWAYPAEHEKRRKIEAKLEKARVARGIPA